MIGLISGTSDGKKILEKLNKYTDNIFVSTATNYGGELLKNYKYKVLSTTPMDESKMEYVFKKNKINVLIDATHPYAVQVSKNAMRVCEKLSIDYIRYERESVVNKFLNNNKVIVVQNYEELYEYLKNIKGTILNTTGSKNINKIINLDLNNRIVHRVLPSLKVLKECLDMNIRIDDIIAIKGPISYELNRAFIKEYNAKSILLKDSGKEGGTEEKIKAALDEKIFIFVIRRENINYKKVVNNILDIIKYLEFNSYI